MAISKIVIIRCACNSVHIRVVTKIINFLKILILDTLGHFLKFVSIKMLYRKEKSRKTGYFTKLRISTKSFFF